MAQKPKTLQDIFREQRMKDEKREYFHYRMKQVLTLVKRLAFITTLGYGIYWGSKPENQQRLKSLLKSHSAPIEEIGHNFRKGTGMIKDTLKKSTDKHSESYQKQRKKNIEEYRKLGIDPVVKYAEAGTKEFKEELEFYRKAGVFNAEHKR